MATQTKVLGITAPVTMGDWNATTTYNQLNWVRHKTATFISKVNYNTGVEPFVTTGWQNSWQIVAVDGNTTLGATPTVLVNQTTGDPYGTLTVTFDTNGNPILNLQLFNIKGEKGEDGTSVNIEQGIYYTSDNTNPPSGALPLPAFSSTTQGQAYVVDDTDIAGQYDLYFHGVNGTDWTIVDNWGGVPGAAATIQVGNVTALPAGSAPTVTNRGTEYAAIFDFAIPQGMEGLGIFVSSASTSTATRSIAISTISVPTGRTLQAGDLIIANTTYSYLYRVTAVGSSTVTVTYIQSLRGATGASTQLAYEALSDGTYNLKITVA